MKMNVSRTKICLDTSFLRQVFSDGESSRYEILEEESREIRQELVTLSIARQCTLHRWIFFLADEHVLYYYQFADIAPSSPTNVVH